MTPTKGRYTVVLHASDPAWQFPTMLGAVTNGIAMTRFRDERRMLGWGFVDNALIDERHGRMTCRAHRLIRTAMIQVRDRGLDVNLVNVCDVLRASGDLDAIGGPGVLAGLVDDLGPRPFRKILRLVVGVKA